MKIALVGDIAPFGRYCLTKHPAVLSEFDEIAEFLRGHDLVVGNLETPFADGEGTVGAKSAHIYAHPFNVDLLKHLGVTHVTLANNHIADYGAAGYRRTIATLDEAGIGWFGAEGRGLRLESGGEKIGLLGYCSLNTNPLVLRLGNGLVPNILDVDIVTSAVEENSRDGYLSIVAIHSGQEHVHLPSSDDVLFARELASRFNYVYYGHHPHVVQGAEQVGTSPIFYSLGNFIFDDVYTSRDPQKPLVRMSEANKTGAIASVEIVQGRVSQWKITPMYLGSGGVRFGRSVENFDMNPYSAALRGAGTEAYNQSRDALISAYITSRRDMRTLSWYLRRLNLNSLGILVAARRNAKMHQRLFVSKLQRMGIRK